jgi:hypothetical protein
MWKVKEHVVWRKKNDMLVVLDTLSGHYYTLNPVAMTLWLGCFADNKSLESVLSELSEKFTDVPDPEQLKQDCLESIEYWFSESLIEKNPDAVS